MKVIIKDDGLKAYLEFDREDIKRKVTAAEIRELLNQSGVNHGVNLNGWERKFEAFSRGQFKNDKFLVAEGTPPEAGEDGHVEYLFNTDSVLAPKEGAGGKVDFHELGLVKNVKKGQPLARVHPPKPGKPGYKVNGEQIPAPVGKPAKLPAGENVEISQQDPSLLLAAMDGHVRLTRDHRIVVDEIFTVKGDVDFSTGNIKANGSVVIKGDVKSGFSVEATGDVMIRGAVEDANIAAGGDVHVKKGFMGHGKGLIRAGRDAHLQHVDNQKVVAENDVFIDDEALHSKIIAGRAVVLKGRSGNILGGSVFAGEAVSAHNIGNSANIRTEVTVGVNPHLAHALKLKEKQLAEIQSKLKRIKSHIVNLIHKHPNATSPSSPSHRLLSELVSARKSCETSIEQLTRQIEELKQKLQQQKANIRIEVRGELFPGTILRYQNRVYPIFRPIKNIIITAEDF